MKALNYILALNIMLFLMPSICSSQITIVPDQNSTAEKYDFLLNPYGSLRLNVQQSYKSIFIGDQAGAVNGENNATVYDGFYNVGIGSQALRDNTKGYSNTAVGANAMARNVEGIYNVALGHNALLNNTSGSFNIALGRGALIFSTNGLGNIAVGSRSLEYQNSGIHTIAMGLAAGFWDTLSNHNIFLGYQAGFGKSFNGWPEVDKHGKSDNVMIGYESGYYARGDANVFLGYKSGHFESGDNKLYIENSDADSTSALIYGDFDQDLLRFNAGLTINKNSNNGDPQLNLYENNSGYARLQFSNTSDKQITIAAYPNETVSDSRVNFFIEDAGDVMTVRGNQRVGINDSSPSQTLDLNAIVGDNPLRVRTGSTEHINVSSAGITTVNNTLLVDGILGVKDQYSLPKDYENFKVLKSSLSGATYWGDEFWLVTGNSQNVYNLNQNIGIGLNDPDYKLEIIDNAPADYVMKIENTSPSSSSSDALAIQINTLGTPENGNHYISFKLGNGNNIAAIRGNSAGGVQLAQLSDRRHKQNIHTFNGGLDVIAKLDAYSYEMKTAPGKQQIGFIAQELYKSFPQIVSGTPETSTFEDPMMVDYSGITPVLVSAIKELAAKNQELSKELDMIYEIIGDLKGLKAQVNELQARLDAQLDAESLNR